MNALLILYYLIAHNCSCSYDVLKTVNCMYIPVYVIEW